MIDANDEISDADYYLQVLDEAINLICEATGRDANDYDRDQSVGECYLDCFRDAAGIIKKSGIRWNAEESDFMNGGAI